jgi:tRNA dimethylallyltransferase
MYKEIAIIAPTASGKTDLSINLAHKMDAIVLSLDSLAVYKEIDIASAKPTLQERDGIVHFGIDCVSPNENFDVITFINEYEKAKKYALSNGKNLIIVGGTSFYLKAMIDGLSPAPNISAKTKQIVQEKLLNLSDTYNELFLKDKRYMEKIASNDRYRIEKALEIFIETNLIPSEYFQKNRPEPIIDDINIFQIQTEVDLLRKRISLRTKKMINDGIIDEVISLEEKYTRSPKSMGSIGVLETLDYLDGKIDKKQLEELITIHTSQLAKRQRTFNKSQFNSVISENLKNLENKIISMV